MIPNRAAIVSLLVAATLQAQPTTAQEACGYWRDEGLVMKVQSKLQFSPLWNKVGTVAVTAKDCVVTLSGTVARREDAREAERIAATAEGVRRVRNELRVASQ